MKKAYSVHLCRPVIEEAWVSVFAKDRLDAIAQAEILAYEGGVAWEIDESSLGEEPFEVVDVVEED